MVDEINLTLAERCAATRASCLWRDVADCSREGAWRSQGQGRRVQKPTAGCTRVRLGALFQHAAGEAAIVGGHWNGHPWPEAVAESSSSITSGRHDADPQRTGHSALALERRL